MPCWPCYGLRRCGNPEETEAAYATVVAAHVKILATFNEQIRQLGEVMSEHFHRRPAAEIYLSKPGLGVVLAARVLAEFGDDKARFVNSRARKNYSGQSPITRASGKKTMVLARFATKPSARRRVTPTGLLRTQRLTGGPGPTMTR